MARKKTTNGNGDPNSSSSVLAVDTKLAAKGTEVESEEDVITVNKMNLTELKNACDDAVKRFLSQPEQFTPNHTHTDVKLALGWSSVFIAFGTALYGWKVEFEKAKSVVWVGVILYVVLTTISTLYTFLIEKDTVYVGKRKSLAKRIETENITVESRTNTSPGTTAFPSKVEPPHYALSITYVRSSNAGKSIIRRGSAQAEKSYTELFDEEGKMDRSVFELWLGGIVERVVEER